MRKPVGRPSGELALKIVEVLEAEPMAARDLAERLGVSTRLVVKACGRLIEAGKVRVVARRRLHGGRRPMAVYGPADLSRALEQCSVDLAAIWR